MGGIRQGSEKKRRVLASFPHSAAPLNVVFISTFPTLLLWYFFLSLALSLIAFLFWFFSLFLLTHPKIWWYLALLFQIHSHTHTQRCIPQTRVHAHLGPYLLPFPRLISYHYFTLILWPPHTGLFLNLKQTSSLLHFSHGLFADSNVLPCNNPRHPTFCFYFIY